MPRPRKYEDDATRAAAWRYRKEKENLQATELANQAQRLHQLLLSQAEKQSPQARELVGENALQTLKNLQRHFQIPA